MVTTWRAASFKQLFDISDRIISRQCYPLLQRKKFNLTALDRVIEHTPKLLRKLVSGHGEGIFDDGGDQSRHSPG